MMASDDERETGVIATFYSFKGGTGRTMALANIAFLTGREQTRSGERALAVDWDLEAPGLHRYFPLSEPVGQTAPDQPGVIDYFSDLLCLLQEDDSIYERLASGVLDLEDALPLSGYIATSVAEGVDMMTAGRFDGGYQTRVASFDWAGFYRNYHRIFRRIREQFTRQYSWCFIDSRTGLTDVSGICTMLRPEKLVGVFTPNRQSVEGLLDLITQALAYRRGSDDPRPLEIFPLPSRVITGELELSREARALYRDRFERCLESAYGIETVNLREYFDEVEIPHKDYYGFSEKVAVRDDPSATDALSINRAYQRFHDRLSRTNGAGEMPSAYTNVPTVYIVSTVEDLEPYRKAVRDAAIGSGLMPVLFEYSPADVSSPLATYMKYVAQADLVVAIVAHRYGWTPAEQDRSAVWLACEAAIEQGKDLFPFLVDENYPWPAELREAYRLTAAAESVEGVTADFLREVTRNVKRLKEFRSWIRGYTTTATFTTPESLSGVARMAFNSWRERHPELGTLSQAESPSDPSRYLEFLREQTAWIDVRGLQLAAGTPYRFPMQDLYIPLTIAHPAGNSQMSREAALEETLTRKLVVIAGDPGSGKTTFVRQAASRLCVTPDGPLPVVIQLAELSDYIERQLGSGKGSDTTRSAHGWIVRYLADKSREWDWQLEEDYFRSRLDSGNAVLLLDGLDAVAVGSARESIARLIENTATAFPECRFVVTTRPGAYTRLATLAGFEQVRIDELSDEAVDQFIAHCAVALYPSDSAAAKEHQTELLEVLRAWPAIRRLARNPVMLTALALVRWNERRLPKQRAELYESVLGWLSRAREQPGRERAERCLTLLAHLALEMQNQPKGRVTQIGNRRAAEILVPHFRDTPKRERIGRAEQFLNEEEVDSGIVVQRGLKVEFWHLTFQEHLAARAIAGMTDAAQQELLIDGGRLYQPEWREVLLLYVGLLASKQGLDKVDAMFSAVLDRQGTELTDRARCAGLLGAMLADLTPFGYKPQDGRYQDLMDAALAVFDKEKAAEIPLQVRVQAAEALGQAGDPRLREQNWVTIPAGTFVMGEGDDAHKVELTAYEIGRYPVTVEEYGKFVEDGAPEPGEWDKQLLYPNRPVVNVSWQDAAAYCAWAGVRLPTEAEWERAARGQEGRTYPWGNDEPEPTRANYAETKVGEPTPVGLFPMGATPDGIHDLAGNVWEWIADWYGEYRKETQRNPTGPEVGKGRVVRGGAWNDGSRGLRAAYRGRSVPVSRGSVIGFRCAREVRSP